MQTIEGTLNYPHRGHGKTVSQDIYTVWEGDTSLGVAVVNCEKENFDIFFEKKIILYSQKNGSGKF